MKPTIDDGTELAAQTDRHAGDSGQESHAVMGKELCRMLPISAPGRRYRLPDLRTGDPHGTDPLESCSCPELRDLIYEGNVLHSARQAGQDEI